MFNGVPTVSGLAESGDIQSDGLSRLFDRPKYRQRNIIERMSGWLKENRRIVTRFDKRKATPPWSRWLVPCGVCDISFRTEPERPHMVSPSDLTTRGEP